MIRDHACEAYFRCGSDKAGGCGAGVRGRSRAEVGKNLTRLLLRAGASECTVAGTLVSSFLGIVFQLKKQSSTKVW